MSNDIPEDPPTTNFDRDCAALARAALFPLQINRDGSHRTIFPALEALDKIRDDLIRQFPDRAESSFFPRRVVLVKSVGLNPNAMVHNGQWQWNGQPDLEESNASLEVIPQRLSVKCLDCSKLTEQLKANTTAFLRTKEHQYYGQDQPTHETELVLCSNKLLKKDYNPTKMIDFDFPPPKSMHAVEEALAHQLSKVRDLQDPSSDGNSTESQSLSCQQLVNSELRAAKASECYFQSKGRKEIYKGSQLPVGYSFMPFKGWQLQKCLQNVTLKATQNHPVCSTDNAEDGDAKTCIRQGLKDNAYQRK